MCRLRSSVGLTQDGGQGSVAGVASTAAHELGHIFNMLHDDNRKLLGRNTAISDTSSEYNACCGFSGSMLLL